MAKWTKYEISLLRAYYPTHGVSIPDLDKSSASISQKASRLKITAGDKWTRHEEDMVAEHYFDCGTRIKELPGRSIRSIAWKAQRLGITKKT